MELGGLEWAGGGGVYVCVRGGLWQNAPLCTNNTYFVVCTAGGPEYIREVLLLKLRSLALFEDVCQTK